MKSGLLTAGLLALAAGLTVSAGERHPAEGAVTAAAGTVTAQPAGGSRRGLKVKDLVYAGDVVETARDASCKIRLGDGSELMVPGRSRIAINDSRQNPRGYSTVGVLMGRLWAYVTSEDGPSGFEVETVTTVTGVRGTILGQGVSADGTARVVVDKGAVQSGQDGAGKTVGQGGSLDIGLDGQGRPGKAGNSEQDWEKFFKQGLDNLHRDPQGIMGRLLAGLKSARDQMEIERAGLKAEMGRLRGLLKEIEGKPRIIIPDEDKKKAADEAAAALSRLRRTQVLLDRFRAFWDLIRQVLADLAGDPGSYPGGSGDAVRDAGAAAGRMDPDKYLRDVGDELAGLAGELEDDVMRLDLAPGLKRLPERKKSDRIQRESRGGGSNPPDHGPPTGHELAPGAPDLPPPIFEPPTGPEPDHHPEPPPPQPD